MPTQVLSLLRPPGKFPLRRTVEYLQRGRQLKPGIESVGIYFKPLLPADYGTRQFVFYNLPQLVYVNPHIQFNTFKSQRKYASIDFYLTGGDRIQVDLDGKTREEVVEVVLKIAEKSPEQIEADKKPTNVNPMYPKYLINPANVGWRYFGQRKCMCEVPGQLVCSKYKKNWPKDVKKYADKISGIGKGKKVDSKFVDLEK
ncbi:28S ribosomal protein S25, mitochondrial-like [Oopsacas minuta]|uniref:Small ribosomal subunit protein mS25 n=1 Tax=Oopsacas minuta TaxID=111878 RepID=A0AAV7K9W7_9METZ|nr:28S ribosomal protein S25, mitochondrial-like [Oopsacas minuta]